MTYNDEQTLLEAIVSLLKQSDVVKRLFEKYDTDIEDIDKMPIALVDLPVSAKTKNGKVFINKKLLDDGDFEDHVHYIVHEATHWLQQKDGYARTKNRRDFDYLDLPEEIEAFKTQIEFMKEFYGKEVAEEYVDDLLDFHEFKGKEREKKKTELIGG